MKVAIIDLGTNAARFFIYRWHEQQQVFSRILKRRKFVSLWEVVFNTNGSKFFAEAANERLLKAFNYFKTLIDQQQPDRVLAVATSAFREANDADILINAIKASTGIKITVISGEREAELLRKGVLASMQLPDENSFLIDIGGGSTEINCLTGQELLYSTSLPLGAGRGQQKFLCHVPPVIDSPNNGILAYRNYIRATLNQYIPEKPFQKCHLAIGTSGSIRTFARMADFSSNTKTKRFDHNYIKNFIAKIKYYNHEELAGIPKLEKKRIDIILSAAIILDEILDYFNTQTVQASSQGLVDGLLVELTGDFVNKTN